MKHVLVIETADRHYISPTTEEWLTQFLEGALTLAGIECVVRSTFNQDSAIATVHDMYNASKWEGGV